MKAKMFSSNILNLNKMLSEKKFNKFNLPMLRYFVY